MLPNETNFLMRTFCARLRLKKDEIDVSTKVDSFRKHYVAFFAVNLGLGHTKDFRAVINTMSLFRLATINHNAICFFVRFRVQTEAPSPVPSFWPIPFL